MVNGNFTPIEALICAISQNIYLIISKKLNIIYRKICILEHLEDLKLS